MTGSKRLRIALLANSMRSVDDRLTAPHMQIIRDIRKGLRGLGHQATIYGVSDGETPTRSIIRSHWSVVKGDLEKRVKNESRAARQEMRRILEGLAFARETSNCVDAVVHANRSADLLHMHWVGHLFGALISSIPVVCTMHHGWDDPAFWLTIKESVFSELPGLESVHWVVLSRPQIKFLSDRTPRDHIHVVPHGLDYTGFPTQLSQKRGYVAFLGRIMRLKAPHLAIDAARLASTPIRLAGGFDPGKEGEPEYFKTEIEPRLGRQGQAGHRHYRRAQQHPAGVILQRPARSHRPADTARAKVGPGGHQGQDRRQYGQVRRQGDEHARTGDQAQFGQAHVIRG